MKIMGIDLRRAAPLAFVFAAMACGGGMGGGAGGCGPAFDADKIAADAKKGNNTKEGAAARAAAADAVIKTGEGYKKDGFAGAVEGFSGSDALPGSPKSEFARLARSLPPTPENQKLIEKAMGEDAARSGPGRTTDLAGNGGYASIVTGADGQPKWQWNAYGGNHPAPYKFDKPYVPPAGTTGTATTPAADTPAAGSTTSTETDPAMVPPAGYTGCWPKPPPVSKINLHLMGGNGNRTIVDSTPIVCNRNYCAIVMKDPNRGCCPLRPEGDPMRSKCEAEVMGKKGPRWMFKGNGRIQEREDNPYLAWAYGIGWAGACSGISPVCNWIEVKNKNAVEELEAEKAKAAAGAGGGGSSGSGSPSRSGGSSPSSSAGTPMRASTDTAPGNSNLESLIPTIPAVEAPTDTPPH